MELTHDILRALYDKKYAKRVRKIIEARVISNPKEAYYYAADILGGRFPEGEAAIATEALPSLWYAQFVLSGPFPAGEDAISEKGHRAFIYATHILHSRFPAGEPAIAADDYYAPLYKNFFNIQTPFGDHHESNR